MNRGNLGEAIQHPELQAGATRRPYPRNPIGVIALFVSFIEVVATVSLKLLLDVKSPSSNYVVVFIIAFPLFLSFLFFCTLWFRRESLYSPSDFREDASFVQLLAKVDARFESVEIRQKAAWLDVTGDPDDVFALVPELLEKGEFEAVAILGRGFLKVRRHSRALKVFEHLAGVNVPDDLRRQVIAFTAYSLNGLGHYEKALHELEVLQGFAPKEAERFWPALARSYSHLKLGNREQFEVWLKKAKKAAAAFEDLSLAFAIYPDLRPHLAENTPSREVST